MQRKGKDIALFVRTKGKEYKFYTYPNEYRNLMELLNDKLYLEEFGECKGVGRCGTCIIQVNSTDIELEEPERNEQTTLQRCHIIRNDIRLACQILIDSAIDGLRLEVIEGDYLWMQASLYT